MRGPLMSTVAAGACLIFLNQARSAEKACICEFKTEKVQIEYWVKKDQLQSRTNSWRPQAFSFPVNLKQYVDKAKQHLAETKKETNPLRLTDITIRSYTEQSAPPDKLDLLLPWHWYMTFIFAAPNPTGGEARRPDYQVVILLDGTVAEQKIIRWDPE